MINKNAWDKLPEEYQVAIETAAKTCCGEQLARYTWNDITTANKMLTEDGVIVTALNEDDWQTIRETCRQVYEEEAAVNENFNKVYSSMMEYRDISATYRDMLGDYSWGFNYDDAN